MIKLTIILVEPCSKNRPIPSTTLLTSPSEVPEALIRAELTAEAIPAAVFQAAIFAQGLFVQIAAAKVAAAISYRVVNKVKL